MCDTFVSLSDSWREGNVVPLGRHRIQGRYKFKPHQSKASIVENLRHCREKHDEREKIEWERQQ